MTTPLPFSPFVNPEFVDPDNRFVLDPNRFLRDIMEPTDRMPIFLTDPSPAFLAAIHRDLAELTESIVRRG